MGSPVVCCIKSLRLYNLFFEAIQDQTAERYPTLLALIALNHKKAYTHVEH